VNNISSNPSPLISVIIPAYNAENTIAIAIESILQQSFQDFECILIDDGSTDATRSIINSFAIKDQRIVSVFNEENMGVSNSLNKGLNISRGKFIARLDADDISLPDRLEKQIAYFSTHTNVDLLGGRYIAIDEYGQELFISPPFFESDFLIRWRMLFCNSFITSTVMIRKSVVQKIGGFNTNKLYSQDYDMWIQVIQTGKVANLPDVLIKLRRWPKMISFQHKEEQFEIAQMISWQHFQSVISLPGITREDYTCFQNYFTGGLGLVHTQLELALAKQWLHIYRFFCKIQPHTQSEQRQLNNWMKNNVIQTRSTVLRVPQIFLLFPYDCLVFFIKATAKSLRSRLFS
jgi:glycosyltransferase involved in cell wall biosynthesis